MVITIAVFISVWHIKYSINGGLAMYGNHKGSKKMNKRGSNYNLGALKGTGRKMKDKTRGKAY